MSGVPATAIYGTGGYVPAKKLTNDDFIRFLDTSDEWITTRTGIKERRIAAPEEATSDLCVPAARQAIENAQIPPDEIDMIIVGTITPDHFFPSASCLVQQKLGLTAREIPCFDVSAACSGFIYALSTARAYVAAGMARNVLVIGAEILSRLLDYTDRTTCILFGDGAGAVVVGPQRQNGPSHRILSTSLHADGGGADMLMIPAGGSRRPTTHATVDERLHYVRLDGREVFRFGVTKVCEIISRLMKEHNLTASDIGAIVPHQANIRIIESAADRLNLPLDLFITNIAKYGNTSSASVPIALDEASRAGRLPKGKPIIMLAFGAGMTWSSAVIEW